MQIREKQAIYAILCVFLSQIFASQLAFAALPMQPHDGSGSLDVSKSIPIVRVLRSDEESIVLAFSVEDFQCKEQFLDGRQFDFLSLPESGYTSQIGAPQLPVKGVLVATPPEAEAHLTILEVSEVLLSSYHIPPVPQPTFHPIEDDLQPTRYEYKEDADIYFSNRFYPDKLAELSFSGMLRDQHVVGIRFYPLRYNPLTKQLRFYQHITVQIRLTYNNLLMRKRMRQTSPEVSDPFEFLYQKAILNYGFDTGFDTASPTQPKGSAKKWRSKNLSERPALERRLMTAPTRLTSSDSYKIYIREPGIYRLEAYELKNAGIDLSALEPRKIALTNRGTEVRIDVHGEEDGRFDPGDYIVFYGTVDEEDYSPYNVYWLSVGADFKPDSTGQRMNKKDSRINETLRVPESFLYTVHEEKNKPYRHWATFPNSEKVDRFFWERIFAHDKFAFDVNIPFPADTSADCTVRVMLQGNTSLAHHTRIYLNRQLLEDATWHGQTQHLAEIRTPQTLLREGVNTLNVEMPGDVAKVDVIYFNWFEIDYHRRYMTDTDSLEFRPQGSGHHRFVVEGFTQEDIWVYDITDATNPIQMVNPEIERTDAKYQVSFADEVSHAKTYLALTHAQTKKPVQIVKEVSSNLRSMENGSDYIIITHEDFYKSILPLAQLREQEGMRVEVVDVADIYDEFNDGLPSDTAIRDFLQYAYHYWIPPSPFCVLLVGDASYDHKDYYGFDTGFDTLRYSTQEATQPHMGDINFVPTHLFNAPYFGDSASDTWFVTVSGVDPLPDMIIGRLPVRTNAQAKVLVEKIMRYEQHPTPGDWQRHILLVADDGKMFEENSEELAQKIPTDYDITKVYLSNTLPTPAKRTIFNTINQGCAVADYTGHGAWSRWAREKIFQTEDVELLNNTNKLPFVINVTCLAGFFAHPLRDNILGENLVLAEGKGAIATLGACGMASASWQNLFNKLVFEQLFTQRRQRLGTAILLAKIALITHRGQVGDSGMYNLLGDAALKLALPKMNIAWDVNSDGTVDILDLVIVGSHFGEQVGAGFEPATTAHPNPDVNGDGIVDISDLVMVGTHFGEEYSEVMAAPRNVGGEAAIVWLEASEFSDDFVSVDVKVKEARELQGFQWNLNFTPSFLEVLHVTEGNFLKGDGETTHWRAPDIDSLNGRIIGAVATRLTERGLSGEGVLATIFFRVNTNDSDFFKNLRLADVKLAPTPQGGLAGKACPSQNRDE